MPQQNITYQGSTVQGISVQEIQNETERIYQELTDSIKTAQRIQLSYLPPDEKIKRYIPDFFVLYLPKDIVSGDFYWMHVKYGKIYLAAVDCTGHGVAGAFMSIIGANLLKQIVIENPTFNAGEILTALTHELINTLNQNSDNAITKDGMDAALCIIDTDENIIHFAGANCPLYIINQNEIKQIAPNKYGVGLQVGTNTKPFTNHLFVINENDKFYMFSDGFASQFGGVDGTEKLKYNRFREFLLETSKYPFSLQKNVLQEKLYQWKGDTEQTDDIMVMGFSVPLTEEF